MTKLYTRDIGWLIGAVVGAPVLMALLSTLIDETKNRHVLVFVATLLAFFFGIFPAIEMMHSERTIYQRERMVNLKIPSYLLSKLSFLLAFGMWQAFTIAGIMVWYAGADAPFSPCFLTLLTVQLAGVTVGLFFSTLARSAKVALLLMLVWVVLMIAFSGFLVKLPDLRDNGTQWILAPSAMRWGMGGLMDVTADTPGWALEKFGFETEVWQLNAVVNLFLSAIPTLLTIAILKLRDRV